MHDVLIVGAGPAGSHAAYCLASRGYDVVVLEEHDVVGKPTNCSGLIGTEVFERFSLPTRSIVRSFDSARFISPGAEALVRTAKPIAHVVDRADFDRSLAERAQAAGASYRLGTSCLGIARTNGAITARVRSRDGEGEIKARAGIVAAGVKYGLLKAVGARRPTRFLSTAQAEVRMSGVREVEVYLGRSISPGSFAWAIPLGGGMVKLGVCNRSNARAYLKRLLESPLVRSRLADDDVKIKSMPIPIAPARRSYGDHVLVVGDAAGQVKPTTGGGIYYSVVCADIAARTLDEAYAAGDFGMRQMARYEARWRREIGWELRVGSFFRSVGWWLSDAQIDRLIGSYRNPEFRALVHRTAEFERHSRFILALLRSRAFWGATWTSLLRRVG